MEGVPALDAAVDAWARGARTPWLYEATGWLTHLGDNPVLLLVSLGGALVLWRRGRPRSALILLLAAPLGMLLVEGTKELVCRPRPQFLASHWGEDRPSFSYPSGHAFNSTAAYLTAALLLGGRRWPVAAAA